MNILKSMVFLTAIVCCANQTYALSEEIIVDTKDGATSFGIQIDYPTNCDLEKYPTVVMVGGTGLYYRNVSLGISGTSRDLVFKDLSDRVTQNYCVATVRYDYRGVSCDLVDQMAIERCLDENVRETLTDKTQLEDIQLVYDTVKNHPKLDTQKVTLMGHSEGSINVARLIANNSVKAKSLVFFGGVTESPKSLIRWQFVDRSADRAFAMDTDSDGVLTNLEIIKGYDNSQFANLVPIQTLLSPSGAWNRFGLEASFNYQYSFVVATALIQPDTKPYIINDLTFSGYGWLKRWFTDDTSVMENLKNYTGPISYFNGSIDSEAPGRKQMDFMAGNIHMMKSIPDFKLIEGRGHCLGTHPQYGPMDEQIADELAARLVRDIL